MKTMDQKLILLVEDEAIIALSEAQTLKSFGYTVIIAHSGEEAIMTAEKNQDISLILMDIDLGRGIGGPEAAQQILQNGNIPIVFLTSHSDESSVNRVNLITRYGYVIKNSGNFVLRSAIEMAFKLFESEEKYQTAFRTSPNAVNMTTMDGVYIDVNDGFLTITGYSREEVIGKSTSEIKIWADPENRKEFIRELRENGLVKNYEVQLRMKNGGFKTCLMSARIISISKTPYILTITQDISDQKKTENMLREKEKTLNTFIKTLIEGFALNECIFNNQGEMTDFRILDVNEAFYSIADFEPGQVIGNTATQLYGLTSDSIRNFWQSHKGSNSSFKGEKLSPLHKKRYSYSVSPFVENKFVTTFLFHSDQNQNKAELREREEKNRLFSDTISITAGDEEKHLSAFPLQEKSEQEIKEDLLSESRLLAEMGKIGKIGGWKRNLRTQKIQWTESLYSIYEADADFVPTFEKVTAFFSLASKEKLVQANQHLLESGLPFDIELEMTTAKGSHKWVRIIGRAEYLDGKIDSLTGILQDITERKTAEKAFMESSQLNSAVIQNAKEGIILYDQNLLYTVWNPYMETITGLSASEVIGKHPKDLFPYLGDSQVLSSLENALLGKSTTTKDYFYAIPGTGKTGWAFDTNSPFRDSDGKIIGVIGIVRDISERKQTEEALVRSGRLLTEMGQIAKIGAWKVDVATNNAEWTEELYNIYEVDSTFLPNTEKGKKFYTDSSREILRNAVQHTMNTQQPFEVEVEAVTEKGNRRWLRIIGRVNSRDGKITHRLGTTQDITEKKKTADALIQTHTLMTTIFESSPDVIVFALDKDYRYIAFNEMHKRVMKKLWGKEISIGTRMLDIIGNPLDRESAQLNFDRALKGEHFQIMEEYGDEKLSRLYWQDYYSPLVTGGGTIFGLTCFVLNHTKQKLAENKIKMLLQEKETILREVHHRIKNNMNTMTSILSLQANTLKDPHAVSALNDAQSRFRSMVLLYDKLIQTDRLEGVSLRNYLPPLIHDIVSMFPNSGIVRTETRIEDMVIGAKDLSALGMIINELITNAMKYAFIGKNQGLIYVTAEKVENAISIIVGNDGIVIPETVNFETPSGFGLMLVKTLTQQLQGTVRIERNSGTQFVFSFKRNDDWRTVGNLNHD